MRSTGEVMGVGINFGEAFLKAQISAGSPLPENGTVFISVNDHHKPEAVDVGKRFAELGFKLVATRGTAAYLRAHGLDVDVAYKINEGRPHVGDRIYNKEIALVINTPMGRESFFDDRTVRRAAMMNGVPCITTLTGGAATVSAIRALRDEGLEVRSLQEYHASVPTV
jgi:carbamoyl-phosphate synthase large subunit